MEIKKRNCIDRLRLMTTIAVGIFNNRNDNQHFEYFSSQHDWDYVTAEYEYVSIIFSCNMTGHKIFFDVSYPERKRIPVIMLTYFMPSKIKQPGFSGNLSFPYSGSMFFDSNEFIVSNITELKNRVIQRYKVELKEIKNTVGILRSDE